MKKNSQNRGLPIRRLHYIFSRRIACEGNEAQSGVDQLWAQTCGSAGQLCEVMCRIFANAQNNNNNNCNNAPTFCGHHTADVEQVQHAPTNYCLADNKSYNNPNNLSKWPGEVTFSEYGMIMLYASVAIRDLSGGDTLIRVPRLLLAASYQSPAPAHCFQRAHGRGHTCRWCLTMFEVE